MKPFKTVILSHLAITLSCFSQGAFQDLDFEQASPTPEATSTTLFPGWQILTAGTPTTLVGYDGATLGTPLVSLWDDKTGYTPIQGNYTAFLQSAAGGGTPPTISDSVSLVQTGAVPLGTESIELDAYEANQGSFVLSFDGKAVNMVPLQTFPNYTMYGGNVSEWAGQSATLDITQLAPSSGDGEFSPSVVQLDDITFSPNAITTTPEPDPFILMGIGGALFAAYRRFASKRR